MLFDAAGTAFRYVQYINIITIVVIVIVIIIIGRRIIYALTVVNVLLILMTRG